jgi:putative MATE family efflux protein
MQKFSLIQILKRKQSDSTMEQLVRLALPVIAVSFMSMAYNFINIIFVGKLGSDAVAAVGSASFFMNLSWGISGLLTVGAGIKVSHAIGEKNIQLAKSYVRSGILAVIVVAISYYLIIVLSSHQLISFIRIKNPEIEQSASSYLILAGASIPFSFQNLFFTSVFIGHGDSRSPFRINALAFGINMVLDPILIFLVGLSIQGAAIATVFSQVLATILFYRKLYRTEDIRPVGVPFQRVLLKKILGLGISPTIQRISFTIVAIFMARIISNWGATAIAVQKVGIQIEAISYMTVGGFMSALASISGKAYGAKDFTKQWETFRSGIMLAFLIGLITSVLFILFPGALFSIFLKEPESIIMGSNYLRILGFSQLFMCLELVSTGAFFGWGRTNIPAISGISLTILRIPMAMAFIHLWNESLSSVWWSISISSIAKGIILATLYIILFKVFIKKQKQLNYEPGLLFSGYRKRD